MLKRKFLLVISGFPPDGQPSKHEMEITRHGDFVLTALGCSFVSGSLTEEPFIQKMLNNFWQSIKSIKLSLVSALCFHYFLSEIYRNFSLAYHCPVS